MEKNQCIRIIDQAFAGMQLRQEKFAIVRTFPDVQQIVLPSGDIKQAKDVRVDLVISEHNENYVRVFYHERHQEILPFSALEEKMFALNFLQKNAILPSSEKFLEARSLLNSISCTLTEAMIHGDY